MEHGATLGDVDFFAPEHGVDPVPEAGFLGQLDQELERLVGGAVLRVIQDEAGGLGRQALAAPRVVAEELAEVQVADPLIMGLQRLPGRALS